MAVLSTDAPTDTLFAEQLDSDPPFFGFSPAEPNAIWTSYKHDQLCHATISPPSPREF